MSDQAQIAYRDSVNWRSVTRADPSVQQILNTCTFCSVFIFDVSKDEWVKQKQEGPLFLVRRNKEPEYGLYMLNRATVKNVLWPLVPGEMRVTPTNDDMLIVERRGEGIKTGIHFGDGRSVVEEFRATVVSICGDPRQKSGSAPPPPSQHRTQSGFSAPSHQSSPAPPPTDDLSRLFAGIAIPSASTSRPASSASNPQIQPQGQRNGNRAMETRRTDSGNIYQAQGFPSIPTNTTSAYPPPSQIPPRPATPPTPPITFSNLENPVPPSLSPEPSHPPGQTVEDLLSSLLGAGGVPGLPPKAPLMTGPPAPQPPQRPPSVAHPHLPQSYQQPPGSVPPQQHSMLPAPHAAAPPVSSAQPQLFGMPPTPHTAPPPVPSAQRPRDRPPHLDAPAQDPRSRMQEAILDSLPSGYQPAGPDPRLAFQRDLIDMLHRDPVFLDQLFRSFQAQRS